jgi:hypothetical protein
MQLASQVANPFLSFEPDERLQAELDCFALRAGSAHAHGGRHQPVVDDDVGTHIRDVYEATDLYTLLPAPGIGNT